MHAQRSGGSEGRRPLRVLHVFNNLGVGGAELWLLEILRYVAAQGDRRLQVDVLLTGGKPDVLDEEAASLGARLFYHTYSRYHLWSFGRELRRILRETPYDAIHDHQDSNAGIHLALGVGALPPVRIVHYHNPMAHFKSRTSDTAKRLFAALGDLCNRRLATHLLGTSEQVLREYGVDAASVGPRIASRALHCAFDTSRFLQDRAACRTQLRAELKIPESAPIVLFVGRLSSHRTFDQKNAPFALDIVARVMRENPALHAVFAGKAVVASALPQIEETVSRLGLADRIHLVGVRSDVPQLMAAADLLLFPSLAEGLGMVAVEAQAAGLRVLASTGVPEEARVVPGLVSFLPLDAGADVWARAAFEKLALPAPDAVASNRAVRESPFSIDRSVADLMSVYRSRIASSAA